MYENIKNSRMLVKLIKKRNDQTGLTSKPLESKLHSQKNKIETKTAESVDRLHVDNVDTEINSEESFQLKHEPFLFLKEEAGKLFHRYKNNDSSNKNLTSRD